MLRNFVPGVLEITHSQRYGAALCTVKNSSSHLTCVEQRALGEEKDQF